MKILVYTVILDGKDSLKEQPIDSNVDYVCYTDNPKNFDDSFNWRFKLITYKNSARRASRLKKVRGVFGERYDYIFYVDGSVKLIRSPSQIVEQLSFKHVDLFAPEHPWRSCLYVEAETCKGLGHTSKKVIDCQVERYRSDGFPEGWGLTENMVLIYKPENEKVRKFFNLWYEEYINGSVRDQLSFMYCVWKSGLQVGYLFNRLSDDRFFNWVNHLK